MSEDGPPTVKGQPFEELVRRFGSLAAGSVLLWLMFHLWNTGAPAVHRFEVALPAVFLGAVGLLVLAGSFTPLARGRRWDQLTGALLLLGLVVTVAGVVRATGRAYGTDSLAMMHQSSDLLIRGVNPYSYRLLPEELRARFGISTFTYTDRGDVVPRVATYPALHILLFIPFRLLGVTDLRWVVLLAEIATLALLWRRAPPLLRPLALLPIFVNPDLTLYFTTGAVTDWLWVLPLVAAVFALGSRRLVFAALAYGAAAAIKQEPWFLAPFLLVWVWRTAPGSGAAVGRTRLRRLTTFTGLALGVFLLANLPFAVADFPAWAEGTFQPLLVPMEPLGQGLSGLGELGLAHIPRGAYIAAMFLVWGALVAIYARFFPELQHAVWALPALPLWFASRSLQNYFVFWIPVLIAGALVWWRSDQEGAATARAAAAGPPRAGAGNRFSVGRGGAWLVVAVLLAVVLLLLRRAPPVSIRVASVSDPLEAGAATSVELEVTNRTSASLEPRFSVQWAGFPFFWRVASGPPRLLSGETGRYLIRPTSQYAVPLSRPPDPDEGTTTFSSEPFVVRVNDASSSIREVSAPLAPELVRPAVLNPALGLWSTPVAPRFVSSPLRWAPVLSGGSLESRVEQGEIAGEPAATLRVVQEGKREWTEAGLSQRIRFPACGITVRVLRALESYQARAELPELAFGLRLEDGFHPPLLYLFATRARSEIVELSDGTHLAVVAAPLGAWSDVLLDVGKAYNALRWKMPDTATVKVFVGAAKSAEGKYASYISSLRALPADCAR